MTVAGNDDQEQDIERDVEQDGGSEVVQGTRRVAECAQDCTCRIVEKLCEYSAEGDAQIEACLRDEIGGGGERREQLLGQHDACCREEHGE